MNHAAPSPAGSTRPVSFFDLPDSQWRSFDDCLHIYAYPDLDHPLRRQFAEAATALHGQPNLGIQPEPYLHVTVQRFDAFEAEVQGIAFVSLAEAIADRLEEVPPFELRFAAPRVGRHWIDAPGEPSAGWTGLVAGVRDACRSVGLGHILTPAPTHPHYTIAYASGDFDADRAERALRASAESSFWVGGVSLVSVDQDREAGRFTFRSLVDWPLGPRL